MDHIIEALTEEVTSLRYKLAAGNLQATEEDRKMAERLFEEQQNEISVLQIELIAIRKSRDAFQAENQLLKRRILALEKKLKG